jgi:[ribosomal protein S18]-alanine N-acetyltransferase
VAQFPISYFHPRRTTKIEVSQRVIERNQEQQEQNQGDKAFKRLSPYRVFQPFCLESDDFLMCIAEVRDIYGFINTLKTGVEDVETAGHGCYINDFSRIGSTVKSLIRHAVPTDFNILLEIDEASFPGGVAYNAAELSYFMNRDGAETLVAEEDGQIVAFVIVEIHTGRRRATVVTLDVRATHRRSGYGTQLLTRAEEILVDYGVEVYDLQVDVTNRGAINFYKRHGFKMVRTLKNYYANGNDAFLMMKEL